MAAERTDLLEKRNKEICHIWRCYQLSLPVGARSPLSLSEDPCRSFSLHNVLMRKGNGNGRSCMTNFPQISIRPLVLSQTRCRSQWVKCQSLGSPHQQEFHRNDQLGPTIGSSCTNHLPFLRESPNFSAFHVQICKLKPGLLLSNQQMFLEHFTSRWVLD